MHKQVEGNDCTRDISLEICMQPTVLCGLTQRVGAAQVRSYFAIGIHPEKMNRGFSGSGNSFPHAPNSPPQAR